MNSQEYETALFKYFNVTSRERLRYHPKWQEIAARDNLSHLQLRSARALKMAYQAVFGSSAASHFSEGISKSDTIQDKEEISKPETIQVDDKFNSTQSDSSASETECFHVMENNQGNVVGALLEYSPKQSHKLIEHFKNLELHSPQLWHQGSVNSAVVDQLGATSALVTTGLQSGQLFRVVGPPELITQVVSGAYKMIQTSTGSLGTVTNGAGKIAGQLRFASVGASLPVLAPIAVYQLLHAIIGTQQLSLINQRLAKIEHTLQELYVRQEAIVAGEIHYAITVLDDVLESRMRTGIFSPDAIVRLALVEKSIVTILERNRLLAEQFRSKTNTVKNNKGKQGARTAAELLKIDGQQAIYDMQCLVGLMVADLKLEQAFLLMAMQNNPADVFNRQEKIRLKMKSHHAIVTDLPSIEAINQHAQECLKEMRWWEKISDFGKTKREVKATQKLNLKDIQPITDSLQPSLNGFVFWRDVDGIHAFAMSGDDLKIQENILQIIVNTILSPGRTQKFRIPGGAELIQVFVEKEVEIGLWSGYRIDGTNQDKVLIQHKELYKSCLTQNDSLGGVKSS